MMNIHSRAQEILRQNKIKIKPKWNKQQQNWIPPFLPFNDFWYLSNIVETYFWNYNKNMDIISYWKFSCYRYGIHLVFQMHFQGPGIKTLFSWSPRHQPQPYWEYSNRIHRRGINTGRVEKPGSRPQIPRSHSGGAWNIVGSWWLFFLTDDLTWEAKLSN